MTKRRFILLALLVGVLAFLAAGCGGDDDNEAAGTEGATTEAGGEAVSGNISVLAVWTGAEGESFQAVLDGFTAENPDVKVSYKAAARNASTPTSSVSSMKRRVVIPVLLLFRFRRRYRDLCPDRRNAKHACRRRPGCDRPCSPSSERRSGRP